MCVGLFSTSWNSCHGFSLKLLKRKHTTALIKVFFFLLIFFLQCSLCSRDSPVRLRITPNAWPDLSQHRTLINNSQGGEGGKNVREWISFQGRLASGWKPGQIRPLAALNFLDESSSKQPGQTCRFLSSYELTRAAAPETKTPEPHSFQMRPAWASACDGEGGACPRDSSYF